MEQLATGPSRAKLMWRLCVGSSSECLVLVEFNHELQLFIIACLWEAYGARTIVLP